MLSAHFLVLQTGDQQITPVHHQKDRHCCPKGGNEHTALNRKGQTDAGHIEKQEKQGKCHGKKEIHGALLTVSFRISGVLWSPFFLTGHTDNGISCCCSKVVLPELWHR